MSNRLERLVAIAVQTEQQPPGESSVFLKVCPRCRMVQSKHDAKCKQCARQAKAIQEKIPPLLERVKAGDELTEKEQKLLEDTKSFLGRIGLDEQSFLAQAPFDLPEQMVSVRPTFKNRLRFFMDRMEDQGRNVTSTTAAATLLEFPNKTDFVNFATDHGVKSLMTADWQEHYAAWRVEDILNLLHERQADKSAGAAVEKGQGQVLSSHDAAARLGMPSARLFAELAGDFGVKPAEAFGDKPEQMAWHIADVEMLRNVHVLETKARKIEDDIQRMERDIAALQEKKPMKYPDMLAYRKKGEELKALQVERAKIEQGLENEATKLHEAAIKREQQQPEAPQPQPQKGAADRLARILALAS